MRVDCYPISLLPRLSRLFLDYTASHEPIAPFYAATPFSWKPSAHNPTHRAALADLLRDQNLSYGAGEKTLANIEKLRNGASAIVTGQQVALFGGPLFTLFKAATAIHRAQKIDTDTGAPASLLAGVVAPSPSSGSPRKITTSPKSITSPCPRATPCTPCACILKNHIPAAPSAPSRSARKSRQLLDRAAELIGGTPEFDLLAAAYTPGATYASAFARWLSAVFADHGLIVLDASSRAFHALGAPVLRHALEHAADLEAALHQRDRLLAERGYHAQVLVAPGSGLLFLIDEATGARQPFATNGSWIATHMGAPSLSAGQGGRELRAPPLSAGRARKSGCPTLVRRTGWPEKSRTRRRISSPSSTPPPIASAPTPCCAPSFRISCCPPRPTSPAPPRSPTSRSRRCSMTRSSAERRPLCRASAPRSLSRRRTVLARHDIPLDDLLSSHPDQLAHRLGARAMPVEGKRKLAATGNALDGNSAAHPLDGIALALARPLRQVSASKMRYQMNRLRRLAANYQLQREGSIRRHVDTLFFNLFPDRHPQERSIGGVAYLSRTGSPLLSTLIDQSADDCPGHEAIWL